jgi:hypothetical protein
MTGLAAILNGAVKPLLTGVLIVALAAFALHRRRGSASWHSTDLMALGLLGVFAVVLVSLGIQHRGLTDYSVEWDFSGYLLRAQSYKAAFTVNPRTPFGYPLLLWLVSRVTRNVFVSGKVIAGFSSVSVLGVTYFLGKRLFSAEIGLFGMLVLLVTSLFAGHTMLVGTDMPALACALASIYIMIFGPEQAWWRIAAAGLLGGLSYLIRPSAIVLVPAVVLWLFAVGLFNRESTWVGHRFRASLSYGLAFGITIIPQMVLSMMHTGNPFYNNRAMDIWLDMYGNWDWALVPQVENITIAQVFRVDPWYFVRHFGANLLVTLRNSPLDWPVALFALPGVFALPWRDHRESLGLVYWFGIGYLALVSGGWTTVNQSRVFLPLVPFLVLIAVWLFCELNPATWQMRNWRLPWREPLLLGGLLVMLWTAPYYAPFLELGVERVHDFVRPTVGNPIGANLDNKAQLVGYDVTPIQLPPGGAVHLTLYWQAGFVGGVDYTVFVHVIDRDGKMWVGQDNWPQDGQSPTSRWMAGEFVSDAYNLALPADIPPGEYRFEVGMYKLDTLERLTILDEAGETQGNSVVFSGFQVQAP